MSTIDHFWAVIPAGGAGTRLWPLSRSSAPKFLQDLTGGGRTLLQGTLETTEFANGGEPQTRTMAAEMQLHFSDTRADSSREVVVTVRDAQGNLLVAPRLLEQRPASAAAAPGACTPEAR